MYICIYPTDEDVEEFVVVSSKMTINMLAAAQIASDYGKVTWGLTSSHKLAANVALVMYDLLCQQMWLSIPRGQLWMVYPIEVVSGRDHFDEFLDPKRALPSWLVSFLTVWKLFLFYGAILAPSEILGYQIFLLVFLSFWALVLCFELNARSPEHLHVLPFHQQTQWGLSELYLWSVNRSWLWASKP